MSVEVVVAEPEEQAEMLARTQQYQEELAGIREFEVECAEDYATGAEILREVKSIAKEVEARRRKVTDPLNAAIKEFGKWYKPALDALGSMELILKDKLAKYTAAERVRNEAAMREAAAAASAGRFEAAHEASKKISEETRVTGVSTREVWEYELVDISQVPREFMCLDHSAVRLHLKNAQGAPADVPGLRFFQRLSLTART